jgi:membrane protein DedA with SNARE-associated domain
MDLPIAELGEFIERHRAWAGPVLGLITFGESMVLIGAFFPATALMVVAGGLAATGVLHPVPVMLWCIAGAVGGDAVSYYIGRRVGRRPGGFPGCGATAPAVARARLFFRRYGVASIFLCRFMGPVRAFVPLIAGITGMKNTRFQLANVGSAVVWVPVMLAPGYLAAKGASGAGKLADGHTFELVLLVAVVALRRRRSPGASSGAGWMRRAEPVAAPATSGAPRRAARASRGAPRAPAAEGQPCERRRRALDRLVQHAQRRHQAEAADLAAVLRAVVLLAVDRGPVPARHGEVDQARFVVGARRAGEAGGGDAEIGPGVGQGPFGHGAGDRLGDGAVRLQHRFRHAQQLVLGLVGIGDEAPLEGVGQIGHVRQHGGEQAAGAAFGGGQLQLAVAGGGKDGLGQVVDLVGNRGGEGVGHRRLQPAFARACSTPIWPP